MSFSLTAWLPGFLMPRRGAAPAAKLQASADSAQRVPLAKLDIQRIAVPVGRSSGSAKRPVVGTHVPRTERPTAGVGRPRSRSVAELDAQLSELREEDYAALRDGPAPEPLPAWATEPVKPAKPVKVAKVPKAPKAPKASQRANSSEAASASGRLMRGDERFLEGLRQAQITEGTPGALWALYLVAALVVAAIAWAATAQVDIITHSSGKVVSEAPEQVINSLEGGILRALHVREGALVEPGEELLQLDPTRFAAQQNEGQAKLVALKGTIARLMAEAYARDLVFPPEVRVDTAVVASEIEAFTARRRLLEEAVSVNRRSMVLLDTELDTAMRMSNQGLMSEVEVMRLRRQRNDLLIQIQERSNRFRQEASTELLRAKSELAQINEQQVVKEDALKRTTLKSPVRGIVKNVHFNTIGGVVPAGAAIMEIVPLGDRVLVEARIKPGDIGFLRVGLPAEVKLTAYDYVTYGGLKGTIEYISPDAVGEEKAGQQETSYYRARIRTDASTLRARDDKPLPVLPGMTAQVQIRTGDRTVLDFLLKPMLKTREAFTEH
ncbi:MAG: HlyD family type I secretion periplasmic adaptor subunit [Burkholderiales bacterium]